MEGFIKIRAIENINYFINISQIILIIPREAKTELEKVSGEHFIDIIVSNHQTITTQMTLADFEKLLVQ